MPHFLGCQCCYSLDDKTPLPGAEAMLTCCVHGDVCVCVFYLEDVYPGLV